MRLPFSYLTCTHRHMNITRCSNIDRHNRCWKMGGLIDQPNQLLWLWGVVKEINKESWALYSYQTSWHSLPYRGVHFMLFHLRTCIPISPSEGIGSSPSWLLTGNSSSSGSSTGACFTPPASASLSWGVEACTGLSGWRNANGSKLFLLSISSVL